jgi:hypothetical protein
MSIRLAQVCDIDCVISFAPLILDVPSPNKYARGIDAILRRVLYRWCRDVSIPLPGLEGTRWEGNALARYRSELEGEHNGARGVEFVAAASVPMTFDPVTGRLSIFGRIALVDGVTYPLEVSTGDAPAAILAFGATRA